MIPPLPDYRPLEEELSMIPPSPLAGIGLYCRMDYDRRHFSYLARYNRGVNAALLGLLASLPAEELSKPHGSHFGSIQGIMDHIISCDINWLRRFRELFGADEPLKRPRLSPPGHVWTSYVFPLVEEYARERAAVDAIFVDWISAADTSRFGEVLAYADSHGTPRRYFVREALDHVFNHQTHHRGQISQILDELGIEHDYSNLLDAAESPGEPA
jgi:uncharacterized damage-inducible protein DinB